MTPLFLRLNQQNVIAVKTTKALLRSTRNKRFLQMTAVALTSSVLCFVGGKPSFAQALNEPFVAEPSLKTVLTQPLPQLSAKPTSVAEPSLALSEVATTDTEFFDQSRNRRVPVRIYSPAISLDSNNVQPLPLVVFSHGLGGSRNGYSYIGRYLAARGYVVMHTQHEGSDRSIWTSNIFSLYSNMQSATRESHAVDRVFDVQFSISEILKKEAWAQRIDSKRIGIAGHSYGANTALLLSGAKIDRMAAQLNDTRIKAALFISAPPFHGEGEMQPILGQIKIPNLHVTGTDDVIRVPGYRSTMDDRIAVFEATGAQLSANEQKVAPKRLVVFRGGTHSVFTDRTDRSGPELNSIIKKGTQELAFAFFEANFRRLSAYDLDQWIEINGEIIVRTLGSKSQVIEHK
jgi:dienelactone hydrolase